MWQQYDFTAASWYAIQVSPDATGLYTCQKHLHHTTMPADTVPLFENMKN
jgi:hypothetical protein